MTKCAKCGEAVTLPYFCRRCQKYYCAKHRLPESHDCTGLQETKEEELRKTANRTSAPVLPPEERVKSRRSKEDEEGEAGIGPSYYSGWSYEQPGVRRRDQALSSMIEAKHLSIAIGLLILYGFSIPVTFFPPDFSRFNLFSFIYMALILIVSFLPHELAHKLFAQRYGLFAEFRLIPSYALLTLFTILLVPFPKIFAPGAVMIGGAASLGEYGKTAAAGPATNLATGLVMAGLAFIFPGLVPVLLVGVYISGMLALINMLPFAPLDGQKVLRWNKLAYVILLLGSITLLLYALLIPGW